MAIPPGLLDASLENRRRAPADGRGSLPHSQKESVPDHVGRTRHSTYPSGEFRELPDDLLIEVGQHTLNAA
jgi:hypothetical protein